MNLAALKVPVIFGIGKEHSHAIGAIAYQEDLGFLTRTLFELNVGGFVWEDGKNRLDVGGSFGMAMNRLNIGELTEKELIDPSLVGAENTSTYYVKGGASLRSGKWRLGVAPALGVARSTGAVTWDGLFTSLQYSTRLPNRDFRLQPTAILRLGDIGQLQWEGQVQAIYKSMIVAGLGYRDEFGMTIRVGFILKKSFKASLSVEPPMSSSSPLGWSQEYLVGYAKEVTVRQVLLTEEVADSVATMDAPSLASEQESPKVDQERFYEKDIIDEEDALTIATAPEKQEEVTEPPKKEKSSQPELIARAPKKGSQPEDELDRFKENAPKGVRKETHIVLDHIGFESEMDILTPDSFTELERLSHFMKHHKHLHLRIEGHTDDSGSSKNNHELSYRRALIVYNYLIHRGVEADRMTPVGLGEENPIADNNTEEGKQLNRRIEIVLIEN
ncbi:MAG: OmpA family protein [Bacteroidota bacterium]